MTRTLSVPPLDPAPEALHEAARILHAGGIVAFPTESFYGLGVHSLDARAVARLVHVKRRPESKPTLVLVDSVEMAETLVAHIPSEARELMARHWPGALTLVLKAAPGVPALLTAGTGSIGVRVPGHRLALALVHTAAVPVTAPSANPSGAEPPTGVEMVRAYFEGHIDLILDAGFTAGGSGSTIVDCLVSPPQVLRQGPVTL